MAMSVAFTKESDAEAVAADLPDRPIPTHANLVTAAGLVQIEAALAASRAAYADLIAEVIAGRPAHSVLAPRETSFAGAIGPIMAGRWRGQPRQAIHGSGYVVHSLEAALWAVGRSGSFAEAVLTAANLGDDADTTAAIAGQLAGAIWGASGIPEAWLKRVAWAPRIRGMAESLIERS